MRHPRRYGELDSAGSDAGAAAPYEEGAVQGGGVGGGIGEGEEVLLVETRRSGGYSEREDHAEGGGDFVGQLGDGGSGDDGVFLEGAVGRRVGGVDVAVAGCVGVRR